MSHNIENNEVMTVGKSWHGLGQVVEEAKTFDQALELGKLDWDVDMVPLFGPEGQRTEARGVRRIDADRILGVVGQRYTPFQNRDAFSFFEPFMDRADALFHTAGAIHGGKKVWMSVKLPNYIQVKGDKSGTELYAVIVNSHDGSGSIQMITTPVRIVCNNTLRAAVSHAHSNNGIYKVRHTLNAESRVKDAAQALGIANTYWDELKEMFGAMAEKQINENKIKEVVEAIYPATPQFNKQGVKEFVVTTRTKNKRESFVDDLFDAVGQKDITEGTGWWLYNGVTSHLKNRVKDDEKLLEKELIDGDKLRTKVSSLILA